MRIGSKYYRFSLWRLLFTVAAAALAVMGLRGFLPGEPLPWVLPATAALAANLGDILSTPLSWVGLFGFVRLPDEPKNEGAAPHNEAP